MHTWVDMGRCGRLGRVVGNFVKTCRNKSKLHQNDKTAAKPLSSARRGNFRTSKAWMSARPHAGEGTTFGISLSMASVAVSRVREKSQQIAGGTPLTQCSFQSTSFAMNGYDWAFKVLKDLKGGMCMYILLNLLITLIILYIMYIMYVNGLYDLNGVKLCDTVLLKVEAAACDTHDSHICMAVATAGSLQCLQLFHLKMQKGYYWYRGTARSTWHYMYYIGCVAKCLGGICGFAMICPGMPFSLGAGWCWMLMDGSNVYQSKPGSIRQHMQ